jgi:hypothetical protein
MTLYDDSVDAEDIDPDVLQTLDELDLLDTLGMDSEDIAGVLPNHPPTTPKDGSKDEEAQEQEEETEKKADTYCSPFPSNTNKTPPLRPTMVPLRQAHHRRFSQGGMCNSHTSTPTLEESTTNPTGHWNRP